MVLKVIEADEINEYRSSSFLSAKGRHQEFSDTKLPGAISNRMAMAVPSNVADSVSTLPPLYPRLLCGVHTSRVNI